MSTIRGHGKIKIFYNARKNTCNQDYRKLFNEKAASLRFDKKLNRIDGMGRIDTLDRMDKTCLMCLSVIK